MAAPRCCSGAVRTVGLSPVAKSQIASLQKRLGEHVIRERELLLQLRDAKQAAITLTEQVATMRRQLAWRDREYIPRRVAEALGAINHQPGT